MSYPIQRSASEERLLYAAKIEHDKICTCDPKYVMSCPKMAQLIQKVATDRTKVPPANE